MTTCEVPFCQCHVCFKSTLRQRDSRQRPLRISPHILTRLHRSAMSSARFLRDAEKLLLAVRGGRRLCHHEGQNDKPVKRLRLCQIQRPQLCPDSTGDKAAQSGWKKCKCVRIKGAVSLINPGICSRFLCEQCQNPPPLFPPSKG